MTFIKISVPTTKSKCIINNKYNIGLKRISNHEHISKLHLIKRHYLNYRFSLIKRIKTIQRSKTEEEEDLVIEPKIELEGIEEVEEEEIKEKEEEEELKIKEELEEELEEDINYKEHFSGKDGVPIVKERVSYGRLLRDIREWQVRKIHWFKDEENDFFIQGPCIVEYRDGHVKHSHVPHHDLRIPTAMQYFNVEGLMLKPIPPPHLLNPPKLVSDNLLDLVGKIWPAIAILIVYLSVQFMNWLKGDVEDRKRMKRKEREDQRLQRKLEMEESREEEAYMMASLGYSLNEIIREFKRIKVPYDKERLEKLVKDAEKHKDEIDEKDQLDELEKYRQKLELEKRLREKPMSASEDAMEQASQLLTLRTLKLIKPKKKPRDEFEEKSIKRQMRKLGRQMRQRGMKLQYTDDDTVYFDDVAGIGNAKFEVTEVVDFFMDPKKFRKSGARIPRGVLLCGPPGCGKTMLARAVAGEAGVSFLSVNASEFVEMFIGVGASRVRDLFSEARKNAPAIVFVDEIDAVGRVRGGAMGNDERDQTVNQLLSELDGFANNDADVVVMGATNRMDVLDPALIRAGRFDRIVYIGLPNFNGRIEILEAYLNRIPTKGELKLREISFETQRFNGASLSNLINTASMLAGRDDRDFVTHQDLITALEYERLGPSLQPYKDARQKRLAVFEAGTAVIASLLPSIEPVKYVTIIPREKTPLGQTVLTINEDRELTQQFTYQYFSEQLLLVLASRASEEIYYGKDEMSTLSQHNLIMARRIVQKIYVSGALEILPSVGHRIGVTGVPIGRKTTQLVLPYMTPGMHEDLDAEMERKLNGAYIEVKSMLQRNKKALDEIVSALLKKNILDGDEIQSIIKEHACSDDLFKYEREKTGFL